MRDGCYVDFQLYFNTTETPQRDMCSLKTSSDHFVFAPPCFSTLFLSFISLSITHSASRLPSPPLPPSSPLISQSLYTLERDIKTQGVNGGRLNQHS